MGLLLAFWVSRLIALDAFPPFIDEIFHVNFGMNMLQSGPLRHSDEGRQLTLWWYLLFQAPFAAPIWTARVANLLAVTIGVAAIIATGRLMMGTAGAFLAGVFYLFSVYHMFFERMALADPVSGAAVYVGIYFAYRLSRRCDYRDALLTGMALFIAVGAKVSSLPYLAVPFAAAFVLRPGKRSWRRQGYWLAIALITGVGLTAFFLAVIIWRGYDPFFYLEPSSVVEQGGLAVDTLRSRILSNIQRSVDVASDYLGTIGFTLSVVAVIYLMVRRRFYLPLVLLAPLLVLWLSERQSSRHLIIPYTLLMLCAAVALADILSARAARVRYFTMGLTAVWIAIPWLAFTWVAARTPEHLPLPQREFAEYIYSDASGFGIEEVYHYLDDVDAESVIGLLANCLSLRYRALNADFSVTCPRFDLQGGSMQALSTLMRESRAEGVYVVLETSPYFPDDAPGELLAVVRRPGDGPSLAVYHLRP